MLRRTPVQQDRLPYALGVIERNAVAQTELINQVLDVSRIITGRVRLNPESLDVRQLVERALESVRPAADAKMQTVVVHASDDLRPIHGDRVRLPVEAVAPVQTAKKDDCVLPSLNLEGRSILVVDDDASTREVLSEMLTHCHALVMTADSARAALERLERATPTPALIIADIGMPGENGLSLMTRLRQLPPTRGGGLPAIALSAYARAEDRAAALNAGFNDFLTKPAT